MVDLLFSSHQYTASRIDIFYSHDYLRMGNGDIFHSVLSDVYPKEVKA